MNRPVLTTDALSRSDRLDLLEVLPPGSAEEQVADLPAGELGEPATAILLITLSVVALSSISAWLASRGKDVEVSLAVQAPGVSGSFSFKARSGDSAEDLADRVRQHGVDVPPE
jgi:hypothetical protein